MAKKRRNNTYYKYVPTISIRRIIHHILSFVLTILIFLMAVSASTVTGFLNDSAIKQAVENQDFYKSVREDVIVQCQSLATPSMIDEDLFYTVFTKEKIAQDVKSYLAAGVDGKEYEFDLTELQADLEQAIEEDLKNSGFNIDSSLKKDITTFSDEAMSIYRKAITISYIGSYAELKGTARPIAVLVFIAAFVLVISLVFLMIAMYKFKVVHKTIRMIAYALGGSGLMVLFVSVYFKLRNIGSGLQIVPKYLYDAMHRYIQYGLNTYIFAAVILLIFSISLAFVSEALRVRVKRNYFARLEANFRESLNEELENKNFSPDLDMQNRDEAAKKVAHDEFNRFAKVRLDNVTLSEEKAPEAEAFELPVVNKPPQDDFTEIKVEKNNDE